MRIAGGEFRGREIEAPAGTDTRPTSAKVREALFSILQTRIVGATFLDLFAGSGAIGLEALSRGCAKAVFVDSSRKAVLAIQRNIKKLGVEEKARVYCMEALRAVAQLNEEYSIVFVDAPYAQADTDAILSGLKSHRILAKGAVVVVEHEHQLTAVEGFCIMKEKKYGRAMLTLYQMEE
ncbi:16S rRNA (guanine(966)-N(2))-methyltransferase RsmD [Clostridia bacterium OttesenSCG-928-F22]|nr:16S rRNA (guanine(966)-N(2))-methyltransferase RsmD [Clostridia bacterium OttesenSCG-928-F22]